MECQLMHIWPQPPPRGSPRIERLLYHRRAYLASLGVTIPILVAFSLLMPPIFFILGLVFWLPSALIGLPVCELQIRRERRRASI